MAEQDPHAVADPALPFGPTAAKRVFTSHTDKIMRIFNSNRIDPATEKEAFARMTSLPDTAPNHHENGIRLLSRYNIPNWDQEYETLYEVCLTSILRGSPTLTLGGVTPGQPRVTLTPEESVLLGSCRSPNLQIAQVLFSLLQQGYTHVTILTTDAREVSEVSLAAFTRHLIRSLRPEKPFGLYGHSTIVPDTRQDVYAPLVEFLAYLPTPAKEAVWSIKCLMEDLKEHAETPQKAHLQDKGEDRNKPVYPLHFWRLQRGMRSIMWASIASLMHSPPQEGEEPRTGEEATRPDTIEDPESGYFVNKGDAFIKSIELSQKETDVNAGRAAVGIHPKEFSALGFPQLHTPTLANVGPVGTIAICAGILGGILALRMWVNSKTELNK